MKICWTTDYHSGGNALGYSTHSANMKKGLEELGVEWDNDAPLALSIISGDKYQAVPGKVNILFTMFEMKHLPPGYLARIWNADHLIVPCKYNVKLFSQYFTDGWEIPIHVCHEGTDTDLFTFVERERPKDRPFRFFWMGAPNPRKGYPTIANAWQSGFAGKENVELYLKTTSPRGLAQDADAAAILEMARSEPVRLSNVIVDARKLSVEELVELYHDAHCFVFPSWGEGWGLGYTEAAATGLPIIAPDHTGIRDQITPDTAYICPWRWVNYHLENYSLPTKIPAPYTDRFLELMQEVHKNYPRALIRGRKAAGHIRNNFTWRKASERLLTILKEIENGYLY